LAINKGVAARASTNETLTQYDRLKPARHRLADEDNVVWEALKDERFIVSRDAPGPEIHDYIVRRVADFGHSPVVERYGVGRKALMHLVALGFGISPASEAATATRYPDVVFRPLATAEDTLPCSAVWLPVNDNPALRRFLSLARSMIDLLESTNDHDIAFLREQERVTKSMRPRILRDLFAGEAARNGGTLLSVCYSCPSCYSRTSGVASCPGDCPGYNCTTG
jgi:hypothetical protein